MPASLEMTTLSPGTMVALRPKVATIAVRDTQKQVAALAPTNVKTSAQTKIVPPA